MKKLSSALCFLSALLLFSSCCNNFFDDLSKCKTPRLTFIYNADGRENVLRQYIHSGQLFIYNEEGELYYQQTLHPFDFKHGVELKNIHSGKWHIVAWGNVDSHTQVETSSPLQAATLFSTADEKGIYRTTDSLYRAELLLDVDALPQGEDAVVAFASAHVSLDVFIKGFDQYVGTTPKLLINRAGTRYQFTGYPTPIPVPTEAKPFEPTLAHSTSEDLYRARFDLFRIEEIQDISLQLLSEGSTPQRIREIPLLDYISQHQIPLVGRNEVNIPILITFEGKLIISIVPFKWGSIYLKPDGYKSL